MFFPSVSVPLSGERFHVTYHIRTDGGPAAARRAAEDAAHEQTVELSAALVPEGDMQNIVGHVEHVEPVDEGRYQVVISYPVEASGFELTGLLSVIYGNISMQDGIRVIRFDLPPSLLERFPGPHYGRDGLRTLVRAPERPLLSTALKPMGFPVDKLADFTYQFALGGLDIVKDDHSLANQPSAPFNKRVEACADAVRRANDETGGATLYVPNVTGPVDRIVERALFAKEVGAGGIEVIAGLVGFDTIRLLAEDSRINLPIFAHPAMLGTYTLSRDHGIALGAIYGEVNRIAGADVTIYTNYGGRFPTTKEDVAQLKELISRPMGHMKPMLPMPGGGMTVERVPEILEFYGNDVILLISGGLFTMGPDLVENCRRFREAVENAAQPTGGA